MPPPATLLTASLFILLAAAVRGYSGFGFSMISVVGLSLVLPPSQVVPPILLMEVAASGWLLPKTWRQVDWFALRRLLAGMAVGTPLGVVLLARVAADPMRIAISAIILLLTCLLLTGFKLHGRPKNTAVVATGAVSGVLNGAAAIGGPPVILFFFSTATAGAVSRASLIAYFLVTDILAAGACGVGGLLTTASVKLTLLLTPPLLIGLVIGSRFFSTADESRFRRNVLLLLMGLSVVGITRAVWGLATP